MAELAAAGRSDELIVIAGQQTQRVSDPRSPSVLELNQVLTLRLEQRLPKLGSDVLDDPIYHLCYRSRQRFEGMRTATRFGGPVGGSAAPTCAADSAASMSKMQI